jgi:hypothetical protein
LAGLLEASSITLTVIVFVLEEEEDEISISQGEEEGRERLMASLPSRDGGRKCSLSSQSRAELNRRIC